MFYFVLGAWLAGVIISFIYGNRKLPLVILVAGIAITTVHFAYGLGYIYIVVMVVLSLVIWFANKLDMV